MAYYIKWDHIIIRRHWVILFTKFMKFFFFLLLSIFIYWLIVKYRLVFWEDLVLFVFFPVLFLILNYTFIKLILDFIEYYNNIVIIKWDQIVVVKSTLLFKDDMEILDVYKNTKIDSFTRWFFWNVLSFWDVVIEQQRDELRTFHFIPKPHKALAILKEQRDKVLNERKKKYIVKDDNAIDKVDMEVHEGFSKIISE